MKKIERREQRTEHKKIICNKKHDHRKIFHHPVSTPIFLFYLVMAVVKGSFALLLLGTTTAAGAWILEAIFTATSVPATISGSGRKYTDTALGTVHSKKKEPASDTLPESTCSFAGMLSVSNPGKIVILRRAV